METERGEQNRLINSLNLEIQVSPHAAGSQDGSGSAA
ncbi:conjugal transfer protein [Escherichia coli]|uniref:Conjugal transfer protein n=1 Tax=Escherichia coli TaxID=562 RepID=A0A376WRE6_ECOLX|nr:conjugal transfer protein [Escherichia coli]